jgi:hypothetical protein
LNGIERKTRSKVLIAGTGALAAAGLGFGAAMASPPAPVTTQSTAGIQRTAVDAPTPGDAADVPGAVEHPETAGAQEEPGDTGPDVEQSGEHTDPGDAPGSP